MKKRVLLTEMIQPVGIEVLEKETEVVIAPDPSVETIAEMIYGFDGMISRNTTVDERILSKAKDLKAVASHGAGTNHIDIKAATNHGVFVVNTPGANSESVAEAAIGLTLAVCRKIAEGHIALYENRDYYHRHKCIGTDLYNKTIGIVGLGQIGQRLARICHFGFEMRVLGYDPFIPAETMKTYNAEKMESLRELAEEADIVSLNCPYFDELYHMIDKDFLDQMKPSAYLINCARGQLVDEAALYDVLKENRIAGAALDVYSEEPPEADNPLFTLPNIVTTPHISAFARDSIDKMALISAEDILHVLHGNPHKAHVVNKELL